jgi:uncharacterized small protein (DUF1192 family)
LPAEPAQTDESFAVAVAEVSEKLAVLVREEIELARAEVAVKASSIARGAAAVAVGAVFGAFALVFVLLTIAWGLNSVFNSIWIGFGIVMVVLVVLTLVTFLFAWRKLKVGPPTPKMAIDEAKRIRETVKPGAAA